MADLVDQAQDVTLLHDYMAQHNRASERAAAPLRPTGGLCLNCGEMIPPARLAAVPHAALCFECATVAERAPVVRVAGWR